MWDGEPSDRGRGRRPDRRAQRSPFDPLEVGFEDPPHGQLSGCGQIHELTIAIEEQLAAGGAKLLAEQQLFNVQLALCISQRLPDGVERNAVLCAQ